MATMPARKRPRRVAKGAQPLDRRSPMPLWAQLANDLNRRLAAGEFPDRFPTELHLVEEYGVSRHTVREALRRLRSSGVLVAERGRGSYVVPERFEQPLGALYSLFRSIEEQGSEQRSEVLRLELTSEPRVADQLGLPEDTELVVLERRRLADGEPLALDTAWLPASIARPLLDVDFTHTAVYDELTRRCGVTIQGGSERITPVVLTPDQCHLLGVTRQVGAFFLERLGMAGGQPVEWRESLVRGDRYSFVARWSATTDYHLDLVPRRSGVTR